MKTMRSSGLGARRVIGRVAAMSLVTMSAMVGGVLSTSVIANADSAGPDSAEADYVVNDDDTVTVTVDGTWTWVRTKDCNIDRWGTGWAVDWNDETQPGNVVGTIGEDTIDVGALEANDLNDADNAVHTDAERGCGVWDPDTKSNTGTFGPISHTYPAGTESIDLCVVTYDLHVYRDALKVADTVAGGSSRNKDNSVEDNYNDVPTCIPVHIDVVRDVIETDVSIEKYTSDANVVAGDSFHYIMWVVNNGEYDAQDVEVLDSVPSEFTVTSVTSDDFTCSATGQDVDCDVDTLPAGETYIIRVWVTTAADAATGVHTNTATVSTTTDGDDPDNNEASVDVTVDASESNPPLPETGSSSDSMLLGALLASVAGVTALVVSRRRRDVKA